jgi:PAS domain S-box-containing protein
MITILPFALAVITLALLALAVALWCRHIPGAKVVVLHLLMMAMWALMDVLELVTPDLPTKLLWNKFKFGAMYVLAPAWLAYILYYTNNEERLTRPVLASLGIPPLVATALAFTNKAHGLMWKNAAVLGPSSLLDVEYGTGSLIYSLYASAATFLATLLLAHARARSRHLYRRQATSLLFVTYLPWLGIALHLLGWKPYPQFYPTPFALLLGGVLGAWNVFGLRIGDILPVAREAAIDSMSDAVIVLDVQNRVVDLNPAARRIVARPTSQVIGQPIEQVWHDWPALLERSEKENGEAGTHEQEMWTWENGQVVYDVRLSPLFDAQDRLISQVIVLRDITELTSIDAELRKAYDELELRVQERTTELTQANQALEIEVASRKRTEEELSQRVQELARSNTLITALSQVAAQFEAKADPDAVMHTLGAQLKHLGVTCMISLMEPDGQALTIHYTSLDTPMLAAGQRLLGLKMRGYSIRAEHWPIWHELIEQGHAMFVADAVSLVAASMPASVRPLARRLFEMAGESLHTPVIWLPLTAGTQVIGALGVWGADLKESDLPALSVFASQVAAALEVSRLYDDERRRAMELAHTRERLERELTERKRAEEQVTASLREKEVLLKEVHHRVKNNMQVISSLLSLQARHIQDQQILETLQESRQRIRSMALVHEQLYQSEDLARVAFAKYIQSLANHLFYSYRLDPDLITLNVDAEDILLSIDTAVPTGLLLNELISNALKHAFTDGRAGEVSVELHSDPRGQLTLIVSDDGVGFPEDLDFRSTRSLGMQLINTLVAQLEGTVVLERDGGTTFKVAFAELESVEHEA